MPKDSNNYLNVMFLFGEWETDPRKHLYKELFEKLDKSFEFLIIQNPVGLIVHTFIRFKDKIWGLIKGKFRTAKIMNNVLLYTPIILTHFMLMLKVRALFRIDRYLFCLQINRVIKKKYPERDVIIWFNNPLLFFLLDKIKHRYLIYDYQDNFDYDYEGNITQPASLYNEKIISKSDLVICSATAMYNRAIKINPNSVLINNGNDFNSLSKPFTKNTVNELNKIKSPIIGYLGGIRNWLDFELLEFLIRKFNNAHFVFIGLVYRNAKKQFAKLLLYNNVTFIKYKQQEELSVYLRKFSVGIIPFKINQFTMGVFPNKFFEYMACEIPIVTTPLPELQKYSDVVGYSLSRKDFLENCSKAINGQFKMKIKNYTALAESNSWGRIAEEIKYHLNSLLKLNR